LIDVRPLQNAAWAEFHTVRKRLEKAAQDLHRHEQIDGPEYNSWLHRTFPVLLTTLRELHQEVFEKGEKVKAVQITSALTGRTARKIWLDHKAAATQPTEDDELPGFEDEGRKRPDRERDDFKDFDDFDDFEFAGEEEGPAGFRRGRRAAREEKPTAPRAVVSAAKEIYRRLVQRLHPDRGGAWSAARERLWHEVQHAWANFDIDWLSRLEVEWESANDVLGPTSPLSRLRVAIEELQAARRDIERKLREYRQAPAWRFTLAEKKRPGLQQRTENGLRHDVEYLRSQLHYFDTLIASWEKPVRTNRRRPLGF